jgi:hypothetical protein
MTEHKPILLHRVSQAIDKLYSVYLHQVHIHYFRSGYKDNLL